MPVTVEVKGTWDASASSSTCGGCERASRALRIPKRADILLLLTVLDEHGAPVDISDPSVVITLTARYFAERADLVFPPRLGVVTPGSGTGTATIFINGDDTQYVQPGRYVYDIWMQKLGDDQPLVAVSPLVIEPSLFQGGGEYAPPLEIPSPNPFLSGTGQFTVASGVVVGNVVRFSGPGAYLAALASNASEAGTPARAVVVAKPTPTTATLAFAGFVSGFSGLQPGAQYYLGVDGALVTESGLPSAPGSAIQSLGTAVSSSVLFFWPSSVVLNPDGEPILT